MKNIKRALATFVATFVGMLATTPVFANSQFPSGVTTSDFGTGVVTPALGTSDPLTIVSQIINIALGFLAFVAVIIVLYGGFLWLTSAGNDDKVAQAKKLLLSALIGLLIILAAWGITLYALSIFADATGTTVT